MFKKVFHRLNLQNFIILLLLTISVILFFYVFYKAEILWKGILNQVYLKFYILSIILILFFLIALFLPKEIKKSILLILFSALITIYLIESILTFFKVKNYDNYDYRTKFEVYNDLKKEGIDAAPTFSQSYFLTNDNVDLYPLGGISLKKTVFCNETGKWSIFDSDRFGFNNEDQVWDEEKIEFIFIGDSFTAGACVQKGENIPDNFKKITNKNVINLGYEGTGQLIHLAFLNEFGFEKNPANIIINYYENDLKDISQEKKSKHLLNYLKDNYTQNLKYKQNLKNKIMNEVVNNLNKQMINASGNVGKIKLYKEMGIDIERLSKEDSKIIKFLKLRNLRKAISIGLTIFKEDDLKSNFEIFEKIISKINTNKDENTNLYFVFLPSLDRYHFKIKNDDEYRNKKDILDIVKKIGIPVIDIHKEFFKKQKDPKKFFPFKREVHYTPEGYRQISKIIFERIQLLKN